MVALWLLCKGCIMFPEAGYEEQEPNYPPEIVLDSLDPRDDGAPVALEAGCPEGSVVFKMGQVRDPNIDDTLYVRWFLDWDPTEDRPDSQPWAVYPIPSHGTVERPGIEYVLSFQDLQPDYDTGAVHTFRVLVADRPLRPGGNGAEFPEGMDGLFAVYQWTLVVADSGIGCD